MTIKWIQLYPDGSCYFGQRGGWACVFELGPHRKVLYGSSPSTTSNKMEMTGALEGLKHLKRPSLVSVYSDSQYLVNGMNQWLEGWKKKNWKKSNNRPVMNKKEWQELELAVKCHDNVIFNWVPGHQGFGLNDVADHYANVAASSQCGRTLITLTNKMIEELPERKAYKDG